MEEWIATTVLEQKISLTDCVYVGTLEFHDTPASLLLLAFASFVAALSTDRDAVEERSNMLQLGPSQEELVFCLLALTVDVSALHLSSTTKASCLDLHQFWDVTDDYIFGPNK